MMSNLISPPTIPWQIMNVTPGMKGAQDKEGPQLKEACSELESLFVYYLLKEMRATIPKSGFISGGRAEEVYNSMLDIQLAKEISIKRGIGISSLVFNQLGRKPDTAR